METLKKIDLKPIKKLRLLQCSTCQYRNECNILEKHLDNKNSRIYYTILMNRS